MFMPIFGSSIEFNVRVHGSNLMERSDNSELESDNMMHSESTDDNSSPYDPTGVYAQFSVPGKPSSKIKLDDGTKEKEKV